MNYDNFFLHVGMCKTATTYVQQDVFPNWPGIAYLRPREIEYFLTLPSDRSYLLSCEGFVGRMFGDLSERRQSLTRLAGFFPGANILISVRRHSGYIASLYGHYLRYGGSGSFEDFVAIGGPTRETFVSREDLCFEPVIRAAAEAFGKEPFVYDSAELSSSRDTLLGDMAAFFGTADIANLGAATKRRNEGLKRWQAALLATINRRFGVRAVRSGRYRPYRRLIRWRLDPPFLCRRVLGQFPGASLVDAKTRAHIDAAYADDWQWTMDYIRKSSVRSIGETELRQSRAG